MNQFYNEVTNIAFGRIKAQSKEVRQLHQRLLLCVLTGRTKLANQTARELRGLCGVSISVKHVATNSPVNVQIRAMRESGAKIADIVKATGLSKAAVGMRLVRLGLTTHNKKSPPK
jgi:hypothetical protein